MSSYKVKNKRNDDGSYSLSFGRGKKKLTATMVNDTQWGVTDDSLGGQTYATMKACKEAWGTWAEKTYEATDESKADGETSTTPVLSGPPPFTPKLADGPPGFTPKPAGHDPAEYRPDPFDPGMHEPHDKALVSPLGALDEIYNWMVRNSHRVTYAQNRTTLLPPFDQVARVLQRYYPDRENYRHFKLGDTDERSNPDPAPEQPSQQYPTQPYTNPTATDGIDDDKIPF